MYEEERILRLPDVCAVTGLAVSTIYTLISEGDFPRNVPLGGRRKGWILSEVQAWIAQRRRMRDKAASVNGAA